MCTPSRPPLTVFLSYSFQDHKKLLPLIKALRRKNVVVHDFSENEMIGERIKPWVIQRIAESDCLLFIISEASLARREWVEKEVGLGIRFLTEGGNLHPTITPRAAKEGPRWPADPVPTAQLQNRQARR